MMSGEATILREPWFVELRGQDSNLRTTNYAERRQLESA
jgi:hypothetical protein